MPQTYWDLVKTAIHDPSGNDQAPVTFEKEEYSFKQLRLWPWNNILVALFACGILFTLAGKLGENNNGQVRF